MVEQENLGISLVLSCFNRTSLFKLSYPTWFEGNPDFPERTWPDEILILNDGGATDLVEVVEEMEKKYPVPVTYKHRDKGHTAWSNPAIPHNWLVKQAKGPIVLIIDPEVAFINDGLPYVYSFYNDEDYNNTSLEERRRCSCSAGTTYAIQNEFMHAGAGLKPHEILNHLQYVSTDPTSHQIILRGGPAHEYRAWWKERYIAVGGKDERYVAWGYEDLDLEHRNCRCEPGVNHSRNALDSGIQIVTYGHGLPPNVTGSESTGVNEQLWRLHSPPDGVANRDKELGVIQ